MTKYQEQQDKWIADNIIVRSNPKRTDLKEEITPTLSWASERMGQVSPDWVAAISATLRGVP